MRKFGNDINGEHFFLFASFVPQEDLTCDAKRDTTKKNAARKDATKKDAMK